MTKRAADVSAILYMGKLFIWFVDAFNYATTVNPRLYELRVLTPDIEALKNKITKTVTELENPPITKPKLHIVKTEEP